MSIAETITPCVEFFFDTPRANGRISSVCPRRTKKLAIPRQAYGFITFDLRHTSSIADGQKISLSERLHESELHYVGRVYTEDQILKLRPQPAGMFLSALRTFGHGKAVRSPAGSWHILDPDDKVVNPNHRRSS